MHPMLRCFGLLLLVATPGMAGTVDLQRMRTETAPGTGAYTAPFWPDGTYRSEVRSPADFLGYELGSVPSSHELSHSATLPLMS